MGGAFAKAIDHSLNRWEALTNYLADGNVQIDNNHLEKLIRPWAMGRRAWLFGLGVDPISQALYCSYTGSPRCSNQSRCTNRNTASSSLSWFCQAAAPTR